MIKHRTFAFLTVSFLSIQSIFAQPAIKQFVQEHAQRIVALHPYSVKNSVESWMNKDYSFAFLNFRDYNALNSAKQESFYMSCSVIGGGADHRNEMAEWSKVYDGVFYIKDMYPCKAIK